MQVGLKESQTTNYHSDSPTPCFETRGMNFSEDPLVDIIDVSFERSRIKHREAVLPSSYIRLSLMGTLTNSFPKFLDLDV